MPKLSWKPAEKRSIGSRASRTTAAPASALRLLVCLRARAARHTAPAITADLQSGAFGSATAMYKTSTIRTSALARRRLSVARRHSRYTKPRKMARWLPEIER